MNFLVRGHGDGENTGAVVLVDLLIRNGSGRSRFCRSGSGFNTGRGCCGDSEEEEEETEIDGLLTRNGLGTSTS